MTIAEGDTFPALLRRHRDARLWSQERCAAACGLHGSHISRLESGERAPERETLTKLAAGLGLAPDQRDRLFAAAGYLPPDISADDPGMATALALWRALGRLGEAERRALEGIVGGALALAGE